MSARAAKPARGTAALVAIVAAAVAIRVVHTLLEAPWPPPALDDQFFFNAVPHLLAGGEGFVNPFAYSFRDTVVATAEHPPLYPFVLGGLAEVGLTSADAQRLAGAAFGGGTVLVLGLLGRRLAGERAGLLAAGIAAVHPTLIAADGALMSETLYGLLAALMLLAAHRLLDTPGTGRALVLGGLGGLAALTRGEALLLLPLLLLPLLRVPGGARRAAIATLAFVLVLTPWTVRNWSVFDRPVLVATNSGSAVGGANCDATYAGSRLGGWWPRCVQRHPGNEAERRAEALRDGLRYAGDHAGRLPVVLAARLGRVWSVYDPFQIPEGRSPRVQKLGVIVYFILIVPAAAGALALRRRRGELWILLSPLVVVSLTALAVYGNVRFRQPAELAIVALAAVGLDSLWRRRTGAPA